MSYTYKVQKNEDGTIEDILVDGKPVKRGSMRGIRKAQKTLYWKDLTREKASVEFEVRNPFSDVSVRLNPLEYSIYRWVTEWYRRYSYNTETLAPLQAYDDMKYFLLELNSQAYMDLID
jgi:hypothetical protein